MHGASSHLVLPKLLEIKRVKVNAGKGCPYAVNKSQWNQIGGQSKCV